MIGALALWPFMSHDFQVFLYMEQLHPIAKEYSKTLLGEDYQCIGCIWALLSILYSPEAQTGNLRINDVAIFLARRGGGKLANLEATPLQDSAHFNGSQG